ncbi:MAG: gamma-glutamyl-gamma-aminobutyrate hydrolase family protein [Actinomycetota bacterium]
MPTPPIIGITATPSTHMSRTLEIERPIDALDRSYVDSVEAAGGVPVLLPVVSPTLADRYVERLDGIVLSGGGDMDPSMYGHQRAPETDGVNQERDAFELAVATAALEQQLPSLFICRGMQVLNVARNGTLHQHLADPEDRLHMEPMSWAKGTHEVRVEEGTLLAGLVGTDIAVNSLHHQGVDATGEGLSVVAWDDSDVAEALEVAGNPRALGVQWHPEMLFGDPVSGELFGWLVDEAMDHHAERAA